MKKNIVVLIICLTVGILPLILKNNAEKDKYKATFTVAYDELFRKIYGDRLAKLNMLVKANDSQKVAKLLGVDVKTAGAIDEIEGTNILGEDLSSDLNTDHIPFLVNITVDDSSTIIQLQNGIVNFLETGNEFFAERKQMKVREAEEELKYIYGQLELMDSISRRGKNFEVSYKGENQQNTQGSIFSFEYELYKRKQELVRKKESPSNLKIVDDAIVSNAAKKSWLYLVFVGGFIGLILYTFITGIIIPAIRFKE